MSPVRFKRAFFRFIRQFLLRPVPHTMVSWRFLLPGQSREIRLHRRVFLRAWAGLPLPLRMLVVLYTELLWLVFFGWKQLFRSFGKFRKLFKDRYGVSLTRQFVDLLNLAFLHGVPPHFYYSCGLILQPRAEWFYTIFTHELPHWHQVFSGSNNSINARRLLSDKNIFAGDAVRAGLAVVPVSDVLRRGEAIRREEIFKESDCFVKPVTGSGGRDCFELFYNRAAREYLLRGREDLKGEENIVDFLAKRTAEQDFIIQPLLFNHPQVDNFCNPSGLVTIRLVTARGSDGTMVIGAVFEIPRADSRVTWHLFGIDCVKGEILAHPEYLRLLMKENAAEPAPDLSGKSVPFWAEILRLCTDAHSILVPEILSVGWDVVITPAGPSLLEGNVNWSVAPIQLFSGKPLLKTPLAEIYVAQA